MGDLEDLATGLPGRPGVQESSNAAELVRVRPLASRRARAQAEHDEATDTVGPKSFVPGKAKIWVRTWGCSHNHSDGEYMAGQLEAAGYPVSLGTTPPADADAWVLNSCTVKTPSERQVINWVDRGKDDGKAVVVAGCVPAGDREELLSGVSVVGVRHIDRIVGVMEETLQGNVVRAASGGGRRPGAPLDLPKVRKNPLVEIISVNTGCLNQCTYCKTKHARGQLTSYLPQQIVDRAVQSFKEGVVEIWLTSEDTGAYGRDLGLTLPDLLHQLVAVIPPGCRLRLGMTNPPYMLDHIDEIATFLAHPRVYSFLHVPVQAGSDAVLDDMKREYKRHDFTAIVDFLREKVPGISIATDIICGFPTETKDDFEETMSLCRQYRFPSLFINQFFPRPGTPAAKMKRVDTQEVKRRTKELSQLFQSYSPYTEDRIGRTYHVLITEVSHNGEYHVGHNKCYEQILVPKDPLLMGKMALVKVLSVTKFSMTAEIVKAPVNEEDIEDHIGESDRIPKVSTIRELEKNQAVLYKLLRKQVPLVIGFAILFSVLQKFLQHWF